MKEWLEKNNELFIQNIQIIGECVLKDDDTFSTFLASPLKEDYMIFVEKYLSRKISFQNAIYKEKDGEKIVRYFDLYAKKKLEIDHSFYFISPVIRALSTITEGPVTREILDIFEKSNRDIDAFFEEYDIEKYKEKAFDKFEKRLKSKEKFNVVELEGMLEFYTRDVPYKLSYTISSRLLKAIINSKDENSIYDGYSVERLFHTIFSEILRYFSKEYTFKILSDEEIEVLLTKSRNRHLLKLGNIEGIVLEVENEKILCMNKEHFTAASITDVLDSIITFAHEFVHIKQEKNLMKNLNEYEHILEIEDGRLSLLNKKYYNDNYRLLYLELGASEESLQIYHKIIEKHFPILKDFIISSDEMELHHIQIRKEDKYRYFDGKYQFLEVLFEEKIMKVFGTELVRKLPELQKEYTMNGRRKTTYELLLSRKYSTSEKEKKCFEKLIIERSLSVECIMKDLIEIISKIDELFFVSNDFLEKIIYSYFSKLSDNYGLYMCNNEETLLIKKLKEGYRLIESNIDSSSDILDESADKRNAFFIEFMNNIEMLLEEVNKNNDTKISCKKENSPNQK